MGEGVLNLPGVLSAAKELGLLEQIIIDQDCSSGDLLDDLRRGILYVQETGRA